MLVAACGHFNRIGITVAGAERIVRDQGISPDRMGLVYSAFLLAYTVAMLPGGYFIDRLGPRAVLIVWGLGSTAFVAATGIVGFVTKDALGLWVGLLAVRGLLGAFNAPLHPAAARMVHDHVPSNARAFSNGLVTGAACVGMAFSYYAMGVLIDQFDWPTAFLISSAGTLAVTLVWTLGTRRNSPASPDSEDGAPVARVDLSAIGVVLRDRSIVCLTLSYIAFGYFQYLFFYWINYYFETIRHEPNTVARRYSSTITLAMGVGMVAGGWIADHVPRSLPPKLRRAIVPVLGMILSGLIFELGLLSSNSTVTLTAFAIAAAVVGSCEGVFWTTSVELGGRYGGTAAGLMNTGGNIGGTLSPYLPPLLGVIFTNHYGADLGWRLSLAVSGAVVIVGSVLWLGVDGDGPAEQPVTA
jgi:MFS family permease